MPTRRERLVESLQKEDLKQDLKRLKKANEYLGLAFEILKQPLHSNETEGYVDVIRPDIAENSELLRKLIAGE